MAKSELMKKILKESDNPYISSLEDSELLNDSEIISTDIPALNIMLSGAVDGGFNNGVITLAGKSKSFKTLFSLHMAKSYLEQHKDEDPILVFWDSEFGTTKRYFDLLGEHKDRVVHNPVISVEDLRSQLSKMLSTLDRKSKVIMILDSLGGLASNKETDDAIDGKSSVDMTRAKYVKSLFRIVTPQLVIKNVPLIVINHTYQELSMYPKEILGGGTGLLYASNTVIFIGKQQEKTGKELDGFNFILKSEKSRYLKEQAKIPVQVLYGSGIQKYSGMFDLALSYDIITSPTKGYYEYGDIGKKVRRKEIESNDEIMEEIINSEKFKQLVESEFML